MSYDVSPEETKRFIDEMVAEIVPSAAGVYEAAQVFQRAGTWAGEGGFSRFLGKLTGRGSDGPPEPEKLNLLVLANGRVHLVGCKPKGRRWVGTKPIGEWAVGDLRISAHEEQVERPADHSGLRRGGVRTIQLTIDVASEGRTLRLEGTLWGADTTIRETVEALLAATNGRPVSSEWD